VIPTDNIFYAQRIESLKLDDFAEQKTHFFDLEKDFLPMQKIFFKAQTSEMQSFSSILKKFEMMPDIATTADNQSSDEEN
jgi:hypothetical protein